MRTITEKLNELEYIEAFGDEMALDEGRLDRRFKKAVNTAAKTLGIKIHAIKNKNGRIVMLDQDDNVIPAIHPANCAMDIASGAFKGTYFFAPGGNDFGAPSTDANTIINDLAKSKKSVYESVEEKEANLSEALSLSGAGKYGPDINTNQFETYLKAIIKAGDKGNPLLVWGAPGIGKTSIIKNVLKTNFGKKKLIVKNLAQCQKDDFTLPGFIKNSAGENIGVDELPKTWLPMYKKTGDAAVDAIADNIANGGSKDGQVGEGGVIFFDELARCAKDVQAVALSLIEDRELVGWTLGSKWSIVGASNRDIDDPSMDITLSKALGNRFMQFNFVPEFDNWYDWAKQQNYIGPEVTEFLKFNQKYWYLMNPDDDEERVFASPRTWDKACKMFAVMANGAEEDGYDLNSLDRSLVQSILESLVGDKATIEFLTYWDLTKAVDINALHMVTKDPKKGPSLIKGRDGKPIRTDVKYYMVSKVLCRLDPTKLPTVEEMDNLATWLVSGKDESVVGSALHTLFEMFDNVAPTKFKFMIGNPMLKKVPQYEDCWDKYISMTQIILTALPQMDKDFDVKL